jgi:hypothetical protein
MGSAQSGMPDTSHASGPMRPFAQNHVGRQAGAIALPPTIPQPTGTAPALPAASATRDPARVSAPGQPPFESTVQASRPPLQPGRQAMNPPAKRRHMPIRIRRRPKTHSQRTKLVDLKVSLGSRSAECA